ncbi:two-component system CheB/CheR fusion protein [Rhodoblastus acidophilus]|uniref:CheR family methyltransferase n=1 Tax=Rhodoblastus acidophilus TaxID=1074 RepID=UPI0022252BCA|nr:CheR family methyltransferase [Rhodoblastus acidophilus]MCW2314505.1 two-component system CheB/CheR fusion protein [Rhodoblastus acidophilus]
MAQNGESRSLPRIPVVGVGASAGGAEALQRLFEALPADLDLAYIVLVDLDPGHGGELPAILARRTAMPVAPVNEPKPISANCIYVLPPDRRLLITDQEIAPAAFIEPRGQRSPVDEFFRSLADQHSDGFAIVLSGGGSDGALGVRAIRENGGIALAQDPNEAEFGSMPRAAIASGVDFVAPISGLARCLAELARSRPRAARQCEMADEAALRRILAQLRARLGQDFSGYKRATLLRRIARRMQVAQTAHMEDYLAYLSDRPDEIGALFNDLLISVTSFFRDPAAFAALASEVIPLLFDAPGRDQAIRIWAPACATGEEAYSLAILLLEEAARREARPDIQIFATDLDEQALAVAREGRYPTAIATDVSEDRLRRFFMREGDQYRIRREVRDLVVFAAHSLLKDPPFSRINLISCRNLLIYLDRDLQKQVCSVLHYALLPNGFLFLGASESADSPSGLFTSIDRESRIFQALDRPRDKMLSPPRLFTPARGPETPNVARLPPATPTVNSSMHRQALEDIAPPSMLVDENHCIVNLSETCGKFVLHPSGPMTADAAEIVRPELRLELRAALRRAFESNQSTVTPPIPVQFDAKPRAVVLNVRPVRRDDGARGAMAIFLEGGEVEPAASDAGLSSEQSAVVAQLREELHATRTALRATREQYEAATEELRAANEELQSINEEYRSTAEELETSKEELQSINEEFQTLNTELKLKLELVSRAHNDLQNLMSATDVSTMFLDSTLRIQRFTPRMAELFNIVAGDEGRPVTDFTHRLEYPDLVADAQRVLADLIPLERTVRTTGGRWFMIRLRPYRTLDDKIEGVVATFVDVTDRLESEEAWAARHRLLLDELAHRVKNTLAVAQAIVRQTLRDSGANPAALAALDERLSALGRTHALLVESEWRGASLDNVARDQLQPYLGGGRAAVQLSGPPVILSPALATPLGLAIHELGTNAAKHGALSAPEGRVLLSWRASDLSDGLRMLELTWKEQGGPPVREPSRRGSGLRLIERSISEARVEMEFRPEGLVCCIVAPLSEAER